MKQKRTPINILQLIASFALIGLYLCAVLFPSVHQLTEHAHGETEFCATTEQEQDPCHQAVYHQNIKKGCKHNTHLHAPKHTCKLCDVLPTETYHFEVFTFSTEMPVISTVYSPIYTQVILNFSHPSISLRGPPIYS